MAQSAHAAIARGMKAAAELTETHAAFAAVEAGILQAIRKAPVGADKLILNLHVSLQNLDAVREALVRTVANGEFSAAAAEAMAEAGLTDTD